MNFTERLKTFLEANSFSITPFGRKKDKAWGNTYDVYLIQSWDPDAKGNLYLAVRSEAGAYYYTAEFQVAGEAADLYFGAYSKIGRTIRINPLADPLSDTAAPSHFMPDWSIGNMSNTLKYLLRGLLGTAIIYANYDGDIYSALIDEESTIVEV